MTRPSPPPVRGVVETAIYVHDLDATEAFYTSCLGLTVIEKDLGRHVFFQAGPANVLLAFIAETTLLGRHLPAHGASGPSHFALGVDAADLDAWRNHLVGCGIAIEAEHHWPKGGRSIYFRDPSGNSVELVTPGLWGLPSGW